MLSELSIKNFAIIDELQVQFVAGFNVLTGETGAGKSIILDAVQLLLGGRADTNMIRAGADTAQLEATFTLNAAMQEQLSPVLTEEGLEADSDDSLTLARELRANGRSVNRVNGRSVNLTLLRQIAAPLIDVHGQGEHLSLLNPRSHLALLDAYAQVKDERDAIAREVGALHAVQREMAELQRNEQLLAQRQDMLTFQVEEIGAADLSVGEEETLRAERDRLANAEQLTRSASEAVALLVEGDVDGENGRSVTDLLGQVERALIQLVRYDDSQSLLLETVQGLVYQASEVASDSQSYLDNLEFNPSRLAEVEERLELIGALKRKYGESIADVLALAAQAEADLEKISNSGERVAQLGKEADAYLHTLGKMMLALSKKRRTAAQKLGAMVEAELSELKMEGTRFTVDFQVEETADGVHIGDRQFAYDKTGVDRVEFMLSTNPGEPLKPMAKVASGGETARLMLALKTALTQADITPTLIFDEIDQGIGGRVGDIVGRKLWGLTANGVHQVIVVTHLPQLAGYGDTHLHVSKRVKDERTSTAVLELDENGRLTELAAMLGTDDKHTRRAAQSILNLATTAKTA